MKRATFAVIIIALLLAGCVDYIPDPATTPNDVEAAVTLSADLYYAALSAVGILNRAGKLTPEQYDRAMADAIVFRSTATKLLDNPTGPDVQQDLLKLRGVAERLMKLFMEVT